MHKTVWVFFISLILFGQVHGQNLVPNSSFESYTQCPAFRNDGILPNNWAQPTTGTSDYFNACVTGTGANLPDVPTNFVGTQNAHTGNAYMGLYLNLENSGSFAGYREYMQVQLSTPLFGGFTYKFEMYVSLADESLFAGNNLGVYISSNKIGSTTNTALNVTPQITATGFITDKTNWTKISANYIATGGEQFITIGCFNSSNSGRLQAVSGGTNGGGWNAMSYYYIDDVSLVPDCSNFSDIPNRDTTVCTAATNATILSPSLIGQSYLWSTGATTQKTNATQSGLYTVRINYGPCIVYDSINLTRNIFPLSNLPKDTAICSNTTSPIKLVTDTTSGATYSWNTGAITPFIWVDTAGLYRIAITKDGCKTLDSSNVRWKFPPVVNLVRDTTICYKSLYTANVTTPNASYTWSNGATASTLILPSGDYWVRVTVNGCSTTDSISIQSKPNPNLTIGIDTAICPNTVQTLDASAANANKYTWQNGLMSPYLTHKGGGLFWVEIEKDGCTYRDTIVIGNKTLPVINLGPNQIVCKENLVTLTVNTPNALSFLWSNGNTTSSIQAQAPGSFWALVSDTSGCFNADTVRLDTFTSPILDLGPDQFFCEGSDYTITPNNTFTSYLWQDGTTTTSYSAQISGSYRLTVTDNNGCKAWDTIILTTIPKPAIQTNSLVTVCRQDTLLTIAGKFKSIRWDNGSTSSSYLARDLGVYRVYVTDSNNCSNELAITVETNCPASIYVPSAFSPNNDGFNDDFFAGTSDVVKFNMKIYSRWGLLVFETNNPKATWDGKVDGQLAQDDMYVYVITYTGGDKKSGTLNGQVTLLR